MSNVNRVPGKPRINVTTFQKVVPVSCARIPVKLKFAKIQIADAPPSLPVGAVDVPSAAAHEHTVAKVSVSRHKAPVLLSKPLLNMLAC
jgi:hypothetical protein